MENRGGEEKGRGEEGEKRKGREGKKQIML